jgi:hypothetical protein
MEKSRELPLEEEKELNRRDLLKVLAAAGGGLAAVAFLPGKWLKPVVEAGVLPAHAQATDTLLLTLLFVHEQQAPAKSQNMSPQNWYGSVQYHDDFCKVGVESTQLVGSCPSLINWSVSSPSGSCDGTFYFEFSAYCNEVFTVYLEVGSRMSNTLPGLLNCFL